MASPDLRHAVSWAADGNPWLLDVETGALRSIKLKPVYIGLMPQRSLPMGWWDDRSILFHDPWGNILTYDIGTGQFAPFLSRPQIDDLFQSTAAKDAPLPDWIKAEYTFVLSTWNGREYEIYLANYQSHGHVSQGTWLIRVERPDRSLKLLSRELEDGRQEYIDLRGDRCVTFEVQQD